MYNYYKVMKRIIFNQLKFLATVSVEIYLFTKLAKKLQIFYKDQLYIPMFLKNLKCLIKFFKRSCLLSVI